MDVNRFGLVEAGTKRKDPIDIVDMHRATIFNRPHTNFQAAEAALIVEGMPHDPEPYRDRIAPEVGQV
jgi:hypothetical protein